MENQLSEDWREFLSLLISHRVKYLLVGAHALAVHGQPRVTFDLDVFVEASATNARRILAVLDEFGFGSVAPSTKISGVTFDDAYAARARVKSDAGMLNVIGRAHFVRNKRASGRPKDLLDLELLGESTSEPKRRVRSKKPRAR